MFTFNMIAVVSVTMLGSLGLIGWVSEARLPILFRTLMWVALISSIYCVMAGIHLAGGWEDPFVNADSKTLARASVSGRGRGGIVILAIRFWPYTLIGLGGFIALGCVSGFWASRKSSFGNPKELQSAQAEALESKFDVVIAQVNCAPDPLRIAIADGLALCWRMFNAEFGSLNGFEQQPRSAQVEYLGALSQVEQKFVDEGLGDTAVSAAILRMYLVAIVEGDLAMAARMAVKLETLNREG